MVGDAAKNLKYAKYLGTAGDALKQLDNIGDVARGVGNSDELADAARKAESKIDEIAGSGAGKNIVGTQFDEVRPTQEFINSEKVEEYARKLQAGEKLNPIEIVDIDGKGKYLVEGHHRYVASQQTGIPVETIVKEGNGPVGLLDWQDVAWKKYVDENQFWGD